VAEWVGSVRVTRRGIQVVLGCIWLLDGLLQFQSYMYSHAFLAQVVEPTAVGSPSFIGGPILTMAHFYGYDMALWNTLAAEIQCAIGLGLIVSRRLVRPALLVSFGWAFWVWWMGEGFGMIFSSTPVSPLMGAPGAVLVYGLIGLLVWPRDVSGESSTIDGGLLGRYGGRAAWSVLWLEAAVLWFLNVDRSATAIHDQISGMASAAPSWLAGAQNSVADAAQGHGVAIATVLAIASIVIALGVWTPARRWLLGCGALLSLAYWIFGQSLGGRCWGGAATDLNTGPLLALLAVALMAQRRAAPERLVGPAPAAPGPSGGDGMSATARRSAPDRTTRRDRHDGQ
jgi:hypothetical protein